MFFREEGVTFWTFKTAFIKSIYPKTAKGRLVFFPFFNWAVHLYLVFHCTLVLPFDSIGSLTIFFTRLDQLTLYSGLDFVTGGNRRRFRPCLHFFDTMRKIMGIFS